MNAPNSCTNLKKAIERLAAGKGDAVRLGRALADVVLGQMLPDGVSQPGSVRAHDLVDLQLVLARSAVDLAETASVCRRLFSYRRRHAWPPRIEAGPGWDALYAAALADVTDRRGVLPTVAEAVAWANDLVAKINAAAP